jgi:hypothetical protein
LPHFLGCGTGEVLVSSRHCSIYFETVDSEMKHDLLIGDRVRVSALGALRCPRLANKTGTIVGGSIYTCSVSVQIDGNKTSSTFHRDYLEAMLGDGAASLHLQEDLEENR